MAGVYTVKADERKTIERRRTTTRLRNDEADCCVFLAEKWTTLATIAVVSSSSPADGAFLE